MFCFFKQILSAKFYQWMMILDCTREDLKANKYTNKKRDAWNDTKLASMGKKNNWDKVINLLNARNEKNQLRAETEVSRQMWMKRRPGIQLRDGR